MPPKKKLPELPAAHRVTRATELLSKGYRPTQAAQSLAQEFSVTERTAWTDVKRAQDEIASAFSEEMPRIKSSLRSYYGRMMVIAEEDRDVRGGVAAAAALAKLTGSDAPEKVEATVSLGAVMVVPQRKPVGEAA